MTARVRHLFCMGLTALAIAFIATARLPDPPSAPGASALRTGPEESAHAPASANWVIRLGLATLLMAGLILRLREET